MSQMKGGLGKGLSALIRPTDQPASQTAAPTAEMPPASPSNNINIVESGMSHIEVQKIRPNPFQPRADFNQEALDELKQSIAQKGVIQPVTVRKTPDGFYELISGERRLRACQELALETIPAYIIDVKTNEEMLELALVENLQREMLNPIEIAISYQRLINDVGLSVEEIGTKIGKDRTTIVNFLRLLKLPEKIQSTVRNGKLTAGHARALLSLPDEATQFKAFEKVVTEEMNVRQVEKLVKTLMKKIDERDRITPLQQAPPPPASTQSVLQSLQDRMQHIFGTKVRIVAHQSGDGEITIEFYSNEDLERLFELINSIRP